MTRCSHGDVASRGKLARSRKCTPTLISTSPSPRRYAERRSTIEPGNSNENYRPGAVLSFACAAWLTQSRAACLGLT